MTDLNLKNAFGNVDIIKKIEADEDQKKYLEMTEKCPRSCDEGYVSCDECGQPKECATCSGTGRIPK